MSFNGFVPIATLTKKLAVTPEVFKPSAIGNSGCTAVFQSSFTQVTY